MNTDELTRLYRSIEVGDDSVRRVLDAMPDPAAERGRSGLRRPRTQILALTAAVLVMLIGSLVWVSVRTGVDSHPPADSSAHTPTPTPSATAVVVLPVKRPDTVSGAVLDKGRPLPNAYVTVTLWPNGSIQDKVKNGQAVPTKSLPPAQTDAHGSFVTTIGKSKIDDSRLREGNDLTIEIDVTTGDQTTMWNMSLPVSHHATAPVQTIIDLGARTIVVNGRRSALPVFHI